MYSKLISIVFLSDFEVRGRMPLKNKYYEKLYLKNEKCLTKHSSLINNNYIWYRWWFVSSKVFFLLSASAIYYVNHTFIYFISLFYNLLDTNTYVYIINILHLLFKCLFFNKMLQHINLFVVEIFDVLYRKKIKIIKNKNNKIKLNILD